MRKLVESTFVTLDGVIGSPQEWGAPYWNDEHANYATKLLFAADALLLGRATYEGFRPRLPSRRCGRQGSPSLRRRSGTLGRVAHGRSKPRPSMRMVCCPVVRR
jgi:hypothetical protein